MNQQDPPVNEDTFEVLSFLSGMGLWLVIAVVLIAVVPYKKSRK